MVWHNVKHAIDEWNGVRMPLPIKLNLISPSDPFASVDERFCDVVQREVGPKFLAYDAVEFSSSDWLSR